METVSRRAFTRDFLRSLLTASLLTGLSKAGVLSMAISAFVRPWIVEMERLTKSMKAGATSQREWQRGIEELLSAVDLSDVLGAIDYDALVRQVKWRERHESVLDIDLPKREGMKDDLTFDPFFYAMRKGVAIVPHGHQNMATMHMVLAGQAHARHYDRVSSDSSCLVIKPASDDMAGPGHVSTISDENTNIHWFRAESETVFMFNIGVFSIDRGKSVTGREYINPLGGEKLEGGLIRARRMTDAEAYRLYGKT
jgi:hypothetical protein